MPDHDPVTTSLLTVAPEGSFSGEIQFGSAAGGMLALRGPSTADTQALIFPSETPNNGDYLRANSAGQLYFDAGCSACGGTNGGGFTDPGVNGILVRSGPDTYISRSIVGTLPITVAFGDGALGNPTIGLLPGGTAGQVLTWTGTAWVAAASTTTPGGGGGTPNVLTRWLNTSGSLIDSALSQDATGTTVSAGGAFVVSGRLKLNNLLEMPTPTLPIAPPEGEPSKALMYYQGGAVPFWVSYSHTAIGVAGGWQPINAFMIGRVPGGSFGLTNKISVGRTGMLIGDRDTTNPGFGPFDSEIYLSPLTSASGDVGKAIVWDGTRWVASPAPIGLAGTGVTVGGAGGTINVFPVFSASNILINSSATGSPTGAGGGGLIQGPIGGGSLNYFLQSKYDIFVSDGAIRLGSYLRMDGAFSSVAQSDPGTVRLWYSNAAPDVLQISFHGNQYQAINAIKLAQPGKVGATSSSWVLVPPLISGRGVVAGVDSIYLAIAPPPVNLTAGQVLTWDGAQWTAQPPGGTVSGVVTAANSSQGFLPLFTTPSTITNSALFQNSTQEITASSSLIAGGMLKGQFLELAPPIAGFPPGKPDPAGTGVARIAYLQGQLKVSLSGGQYLPVGGTTLPPTGTNLFIPLWNSTSTLTSSSLSQDGGGWVYATFGMSLAQKVRTAQYFEFAPVSGTTYPVSVGGAGSTGIIVYNQANFRLEYSVNGGPLLPLVATGANITGSPGFVPIFNTSGVLAAGGTLHQDSVNYRLTFGNAAPSNNGSWAFFVRPATPSQDGIIVSRPFGGTGRAFGLGLSNDLINYATAFQVAGDGDLSAIRGIFYHWPSGNPSVGQFLKVVGGDASSGWLLNWV